MKLDLFDKLVLIGSLQARVDVWLWDSHDVLSVAQCKCRSKVGRLPDEPIHEQVSDAVPEVATSDGPLS